MWNIADAFPNDVIWSLDCSSLSEGQIRVRVEVADVHRKSQVFNHSLEIVDMGSLVRIFFKYGDNWVVRGDKGFVGVVRL